MWEGAKWDEWEFVLSWHRFDTRSVDFFSFFGLFLYLSKNQNIYIYNKNVLLKPLKVIVYIRYFWRTKCKWTKKIMEWCFSCQHKLVCQNLARSCKKWKSAQKPIYAPFCPKAFNCGFKSCNNLQGTF